MFLLDNSDDWGFKSNQETDGLGFRVFRVSNVIRKPMDYVKLCTSNILQCLQQSIYYNVYNNQYITKFSTKKKYITKFTDGLCETMHK